MTDIRFFMLILAIFVHSSAAESSMAPVTITEASSVVARRFIFPLIF